MISFANMPTSETSIGPLVGIGENTGDSFPTTGGALEFNASGGLCHLYRQRLTGVLSEVVDVDDETRCVWLRVASGSSAERTDAALQPH